MWSVVGRIVHHNIGTLQPSAKLPVMEGMIGFIEKRFGNIPAGFELRNVN